MKRASVIALAAAVILTATAQAYEEAAVEVVAVAPVQAPAIAGEAPERPVVGGVPGFVHTAQRNAQYEGW